MAEEKKDKWLNYLALSSVVIAVCATLSTFKAGNFSTKSVLSQTQASDQWAYFQSKGIKAYLYELQKDKLELELRNAGPKSSAHVINDYKDRIETYTKKIKKYEEEKAKIESDARTLEKIRDDAQSHSRAFGMAVVYLQLAIVLSSIAALMKKKFVWITGLVLGAVGIVYFANGFFIFVK